MRGATEPRLWTPPLRDLTPETSYGYDVIEFADTVLGEPLDPWQAWTVIHAGELLPDGRPRFRTVLVLVARQQGKTHLLRVLALYWLYVEQQPLVLGTSTNRDTAKESWRLAVATAQTNPHLRAELGRNGVREANGEETLTTAAGCRYRIAASNRRGGRGMTINRLVLDELREHQTWAAWNAATYATNAVPDAQTWCLSNQGDDSSIVLDSLRDSALTYLETGVGDPRLGLIEFSSPDGADPTDLTALAQANPSLGIRTDADTLLGAAIRVKAAGGEELASFRTESMCQRVHQLDPGIDPDGWAACATADPVDLAGHRRRVALCVDVSLDGLHATLAAAATIDGVTHVEVVAAWSGPGATAALRRELPEQVTRVRPRVVAWFPGGPAAAVAAELAERKGQRGWTPRGTRVAEVSTETAAVCMGLNELVLAGQLRHPDDEMLNAHAAAAQKLWRGDRWVYARKGRVPIDAAYALAGAVHLARTLPPPPAPVEVA